MTRLQRNLKLSKTDTVEVNQDTVLLNYQPGRDALPHEEVHQAPIHHGIAAFFSTILTTSQPLKKPTPLEKHKAAITKPYSSFFNNTGNIAKGTPDAWERILEREKAKGTLTESEEASIRALQQAALEQTETLTNELAKSRRCSLALNYNLT